MIRRVIVCIGLIGLLGCEPQVARPHASHLTTRSVALADDSVQPVDAGDGAWVRRAIPILWGRRPSSSSEVRVLTQLVQHCADIGTPPIAELEPLIREPLAVPRAQSFREHPGLRQLCRPHVHAQQPTHRPLHLQTCAATADSS